MKERPKLPGDLLELLGELSPAGLASVEAFARKVLDQERRGVQLLASLPLHEFAAAVQSAANRSRNGWPHRTDDKVFVSVLFAELEANGSTTGMDLDAFKARLLEAHRARLLGLSRCDLPFTQADSDACEASEIRHLSAQFHLMRRSQR